MADHPDSESSPRASSSSDSNSSDEEGKRIGAIRTPAHTDEDPSAYADPESPSTGQQSSDESGSSDGVLVELPAIPDQESRGLRGDRDSGILVNIDGSMQEPPDEGDRGEDAGKEETFEDASDQLGMVSGRSSGLEESMAVIEMEDSAGERLAADDLARVRTRLEHTMAECRKYKEEREVFGRQVVALRQQLQDMINKQSIRAENNAELVGHLCQMDTGEGEEDKVSSTPTPLHAMLGDCSKFMHHLKGILGEQLDSDNKIRELQSVLYSKDQEIEDLNAKASEISVSRDVILSYLDSLREAWSVSLKESSDDVSTRLLASLASVAGQEHGSLEDPTADGMSLVERNTLLLIEKHMQFLSEIQLLGQCLAEIKPDFANSQENESGIVFSIARKELLERRRKESCLQERMFKLEDENRELAEQVKKMKESLEEANAETSKIKMELEQTENRLVASREKLGIAVTKGKSLVQHRDSLKQSLAEKTSELERCMQELQQKSDALQASEASASELKQLVAEKTSELEESMQESQQKSDAFQASEASANELKQLLAEKASELEGFMLVLQQKSNALQATEATADELKQLLADRTSDLERCVQELQQKSNVLQTTEATAEELKQLLAEKKSELERCMQELQQKSDALQASEASASELKQLVAEKTSELEESMQESQQKSDAFQASEASANELKQLLAEKVSELEGFMLVLQQKSNALQATEATADELKQLLADRTSDLERCVQELQQKSDVLQTTEATAEELKQLLAEKKSELEHCLMESQQKSDALQTTEAIAEELKQLLDDKTSELERCLVEMQKKSDALENTKASVEELNETNILVSSLRESLSQRDVILQEIEEIMSTNSTQGLHSMEVIDRVRWFVNQKNIADIIFLENRKAKDALSLIELPETISSSELFSQINWLVNSFTQAKDDIVKLLEEIASNQLAVASHESELSETHKEIDCLAKSLLEEKQTKESLQNEHEFLRCKYEGIAEKLSVLSSEKDGLMKVLLQISESTMDDQLSVDINVMIEKCMAKIRERMKTSLAESEQIEKMQTLLFVSSQELKLCEMILEEDLIERSTMMRLSDELGRASEEVVVLRNDKDSLQKELKQAEEKSCLLREKLSMAVKKGRGLVQEREGFKHSLDEKNSEIEKLKHDLQLKDSAINDYQEQIKSLSGSPELIQKLESDIASLKDQRDQSEQILHKRNSTLQKLVDSIENILLPTDNIFKGPIEKLNWISEHIKELQLAKAYAEEELDKAKEESTLHASRLADASATIKSIEDRLADAEKCISFITEEKKDMQHGKASIEQELEKMREEGSMQASKLADAYATIKSLEDELLQAERNISLLDAGKSEAETKSKEEFIALNAKLAVCMEELVGTRGSLENYVAQMNSHVGHLQILMKDEGLLSLMTEEFKKKFESLRSMGLLIHNMHEQFAEKGLHLHPDLEHDHEFAKLLPLPKFEDFLNNRMLHNETSTPNLGDISSLTSIIEGLHAQAKLLSVRFGDFSKNMDDYIALILQGLQATKDVFIHMVELNESLKADVVKLEAHNQAQEAKVVSLQKEMTVLLSACAGATQELQIEFHDLMNSESNTEQDIMMNSSLHLRSREAVSSGVEDRYANEYAKAVDDLLCAARRVKIQCQQLANIKEVSVASIDDLKDRLKQAELTTETAIKDRHLNQEKVSIMERDLEALQEICSEMKSKIENYEAREDMLRYKGEEFLSLQHTLTAKERGIDDQLFSQEQLETLIYKINGIEIPFNKLETQNQEFLFSSPVEKLFYIIDKFSELLHRLDTLTDEKEDMQLILASHVRELEQLRKAAEAFDTDYQELESKKSELFELTVGLEKIIHRMGGNDSMEDQKPKAKTLVTVLERLAIASSMEFKNSKTRIQELGTKLQEKERVVDELSRRIKMLEESIHSQLAQPDNIKERTVFEASPAAIGSEISEIDDVGPMGKNSITPVPTAAHVRTMRKGSTDHIVLSIDSESDRLIAAQETDDKGHIFKSLNTSGLIPKQGKLIADRVDGIWVSGGRILMSRPGARLGLIAYWIFLHLWLLGTIL